jgi:hypothetical protein
VRRYGGGQERSCEVSPKRSKRNPSPARPRGRKEEQDWKLGEDPLLLDDPGGSPLEWIDLNVRRAVRVEPSEDPWEGVDSAENEAVTERRRRKLEALSLNVDEEGCDEKGESVA